MSITTLYPFTTPSNYTYPGTIEVTGGKAQLALGDDLGQTFNEDFANDTGFTYNASNTEFSGGQVQQIQKTYKGTPYTVGTFFAPFSTDLNGEYGDGVLTGTAAGGAAISGGKLDLNYSDVRYTTVDANLNADSQQTGCIRFKVTPNYSGTPVVTHSFISIHENASNNNEIVIFHQITTGELRFNTRDAAGGSEAGGGAVWSPTAGVEYEIELNYDLTAGKCRLYVDGVLLASDLVSTGTRSGDIDEVAIGTNWPHVVTSNFSLSDLIFFDTVQHTANYTPAAYGGTFEPTFYAGYGEDINGDWGNGVLTGAATGGAAIAGGKLDMTGDISAYVDYAGAGNADGLVQEGCIRFKYTPDYNGFPVGQKELIVITQVAGSSNNLVAIRQKTNGNLSYQIATSAGADIANVDLGVWAQTSGVEYEIELNFNVTAGAIRLFVDGTQFGSTDTSTGARTNNIGLIRIGNSITGGYVADGSFSDLLMFDHTQHAANYTPDWTGILPYQNYGDVITLPVMTYSGVGSLQNFTNIVSTAGNAPRYIMNDEYWDGAAWSASSDTWATANSIATILANIATLTASDTMIIKIVTDNNIGTQQYVIDLTLTYTGQIYPITNPSIAPVDTIFIDVFEGFTDIITETGSDTITYTLTVSNVETYWDGAAWTASSGYAQSNTAVEINTNAGALDCTGGKAVRFNAYIHSNAADSTPSIDSISFTYDLHGTPPGTPSECVVYGYLYDSEGGKLEDVTVKAILTDVGVYDTDSVISRNYTSTTTDVDGYWEMSLIENASMQSGVGYEFTFIGDGLCNSFKKIVPDSVSSNWADLADL